MKAVVMLVALLAPLPAAAQSATAQPAAAVPVSIPIGSRVGALPGGYVDGGRRDPFATLVRPKKAGPATPDGKPRSGLAALPLADVTVRGITKIGPTMTAILEAPGKQSFTVRVKDKLADAVIKSIDAGGVVFAEEGSAGSMTDVRKALRPTGDELR